MHIDLESLASYVATCWTFIMHRSTGILNFAVDIIKFTVHFCCCSLWCESCLFGVSLDRNQIKNQIFATPEESSTCTSVLLEAVGLLIDPKLPWVCKTVGYLLQQKAFTLFREIILTGKVCIYCFHPLRKKGSSFSLWCFVYCILSLCAFCFLFPLFEFEIFHTLLLVLEL